MLGKFAHEVTSTLTVQDIALWLAYGKLKAEYAKKARKKGKR